MEIIRAILSYGVITVKTYSVQKNKQLADIQLYVGFYVTDTHYFMHYFTISNQLVAHYLILCKLTLVKLMSTRQAIQIF